MTKIDSQWFCIPHPEYLALPWYKKLWQRYWRWRNRNVEWHHVMPNWDAPRRIYVNIPPVWWVRELKGGRMKVRIITDVPLDAAHDLTVGKVLEVETQMDGKVGVRTAKGFHVYLLPGEYEVVDDEDSAD